MLAGRDGLTLGAQAERLGGRGERPSLGGSVRPVGMVVACYGSVVALAAGISAALGRDPVGCESWLGTQGAASWMISLGLGLPLGAATIAMTRIFVRRTAWAQALHEALRPAVQGTGDQAILAVAAASATGEELLFRGLLVPWLGVVASSMIFGTLHQIRGRARWGWIVWATVMGLLFAGLFRATGSLVGPIVAHAMINHANLRFLRDSDPDPRPRTLGGLLRR